MTGYDQYGQPNPYPYPSQHPGYPPAPDYSHWGMRVLAYAIDGFLGVVAMAPFYVGLVWLLSAAYTTDNPDGTVSTHLDNPNPASFVLIAVGAVLGLTFNIWNTIFRTGRTGASLGKRAAGIKLVKEETGQPIGAGLAFVRQIVHVVDSFCYVGYFWPLWDDKRQTFADKIMGTVVINQKTAP